MCSNASITEILGINDNNLVILGNKKENIKGIEYTVLRRKLSYRPACCPKCGIVNENYDIIKNRSQTVKILLYRPQKVRPKKQIPKGCFVNFFVSVRTLTVLALILTA